MVQHRQGLMWSRPAGLVHRQPPRQSVIGSAAFHFTDVLNQETRCATRVVGVWVWLFPLSQGIHAGEEYLEGYGFHRWLSHLSHTTFSERHVLMVHVAFVLLMVVATGLASRIAAWAWVLPGLAVLVLLNAVAHILGSIASEFHSSGLVSSVVLWVPLGIGGLVYAWRGLSNFQFWGGILSGILVQLPVSWAVLRG